MPRIVVFDETGGPEVLHVIDEPVIEPAAGEVRVKIEAVGVNQLDQLMRSGAYPRPFRLPHARVGCEGTGTIDAVGSGVDGFRIRDAVIITAVPEMDINGTYADYTTVPASAVVTRPGGLDPTSAAALWVAYPPPMALSSRKPRCDPVITS
jgi:NADPH2:quinone reductase